MKKIKRIIKNIVNSVKSIRISTIYKIIGLLLLIGVITWCIITWQKMNNFETKDNVTIAGSIVNVGNNYIIVKDSKENEYLLYDENSKDYTIGSNITANIEELPKDSDKEAPIIVNNNKINVITENKQNKNAEVDVINFFEETNKNFESENLKEEAKTNFITIVDFLFYNGTIKGYTFNDLSSKAKLQVLKIALSIDKKIENYFPGYKETISSATGKIYTGIKNKIIESYLTITTKICTYDKSLCDSAKNDFQQLKESFSITWSFVKDLLKENTDKLKNWYEIYSGKKE